MDKPIVFISHISEERDLAIAFKELVESSFLGMLDVFVSSDEHSVSLGQKWLDNITQALKSCSIEIILCSPKSISRPWINFEAGAGWIRELPVIPLCHSGMEPDKLPLPLNLLQAAKVSEVSSLKLIFPVLAEAIDSKTPQVDFSEFIKKVADFEITYTFWDKVNENFNKLVTFNQQLVLAIKSKKVIDIDLTQPDIIYLKSFMDFFLQHNIMNFSQIGGVSITPSGTYYRCQIRPLSDLDTIINDPHFKF